MGKGDRTRTTIIRQSAALFNQQGVAGTSLADIMEVTGLQKGGIYRHFTGKDELALAAFDHAAQAFEERFATALVGVPDAAGRLRALLGVYREHIVRPPLPGGCPVMNTAMESDDTNPLLRDRAAAVMDTWRRVVELILVEGIRAHELRKNVDAPGTASLFVASLEGAVMLTRLHGDPVHMRRAVEFWEGEIEEMRGRGKREKAKGNR